MCIYTYVHICILVSITKAAPVHSLRHMLLKCFIFPWLTLPTIFGYMYICGKPYLPNNKAYELHIRKGMSTYA